MRNQEKSTTKGSELDGLMACDRDFPCGGL